MKPKILIVDDHAQSAGAMGRLFRRCGYEVRVARCYQEAIDTASTFAPDVLICEIRLPDGNGCALLRELRQQYELDGMAATTSETPFDIAQVQRAGFSRHFIKPVDFGVLLAAVEEAVATRPIVKA